MPKTLDAGYQAHLAAGALRLAWCLRIERADGVTHRFTAHDRSLTMLDTGAVYVPDSGGADASAVSHTADGSAALLDLEGALAPAGVTRDAIRAGLYDGAAVRLFRCRWDAPNEDEEKIWAGRLGPIQLQGRRFVAELRSLAAALDTEIVEVHTPTCLAELGDTRCGVRLSPPAWTATTAVTVRETGDSKTGSVVQPTTDIGWWAACSVAGTTGGTEPTWPTTPGATVADGDAEWTMFRAHRRPGAVDTVVSATEITDATLAEPDDWWAGGVVAMTSGENAGLSRDVAAFSAGAITLWEAFPFPVAAGDAFTITAGCRKRHLVDCRDKFDNILNFRGSPHLPGRDATMRIGGQ